MYKIFKTSYKSIIYPVLSLMDGGTDENYCDFQFFKEGIKSKAITYQPINSSDKKFITAHDHTFQSYGQVEFRPWGQIYDDYIPPQVFYLIDLTKSPFNFIIGTKTQTLMGNQIILNQTLSPKHLKQLVQDMNDDDTVLGDNGHVWKYTLTGFNPKSSPTDPTYDQYLQEFQIHVNFYGRIEPVTVTNKTTVEQLLLHLSDVFGYKFNHISLKYKRI